MTRNANLARGLVAGAGAGLLAAFVMNEFQAVWAASDNSKQSSDEQPSTLKAAERVSQAVAGAPVPKKAEAAASETVHYMTGAVLGALYGAAAELFPSVKAGLGTTYAGIVWAALDNGLVPSLGLAPKPEEIARKDHIYAFSSHMVFGVALETTRSVLALLL